MKVLLLVPMNGNYLSGRFLGDLVQTLNHRKPADEHPSSAPLDRAGNSSLFSI
jgi:hypothetical protein